MGIDEQQPLTDRPDSDLIRLTQAGQRGAYDVLVRRYQRQVYRWSFHVVRAHDLADEVTQDVFIRTFHAIARVDPDRPFGAWLCRSAMNLSFNLLRKNAFRTQRLRDEGTKPTDFDIESATPDAAFRRGRVLQRLETAIDSLPPIYRTIILLRAKDEMSYEEIAHVLQVSLGTVMSRLARARRRLRVLLGDLLDDLRE